MVDSKHKAVILTLSLEKLQKCFCYLDDLHGSGITNMYDAGFYLVRDCDLAKDEAAAVLVSWMNTFNRDIPSDYRAEKLWKELLEDEKASTTKT